MMYGNSVISKLYFFCMIVFGAEIVIRVNYTIVKNLIRIITFEITIRSFQYSGKNTNIRSES